MVDLSVKRTKRGSRRRHADAEATPAVAQLESAESVADDTHPSRSSHPKRKKRTAEAVTMPTPSVADASNAKNTALADDENWANNQARIETVCGAYPNNICNDCGEHGTHWAVVNWGVFVCIRCSGVHRSLGSHISKVKSTTMDRWSSMEIEWMTVMGNERAKSVLEAQLMAAEQQGVQPVMRGGSTSDHELRQFIVKKYAKVAFAVDDVHRVLRRLYKQAGYHRHGSLRQRHHTQHHINAVENVTQQHSSSSANVDRHTASPTHHKSTDHAEGDARKVREVVSSAKAVWADSSASMKSFYGHDVVARSPSTGAEAVKKKKSQAKRSVKIVHGTFGIVNVPEEEYETRLTQLLDAFGVSSALPVTS